MNWLKKGPDLNLNSLKGGGLSVPPVLSDLYYDLRDRRLLPLVAVVIAGIVAVPFLLGGGSSKDEESGAVEGGAAVAVAGTSSAGSSKLAVVESQPGLREYKKRLGDRKPTDPFKQRYTAPQLKGTQLTHKTESSSSSSSSSSSPTFSTPTTETSSGSAPPSSSPSSPVPGTGKPQIVLFSWAIDVRITKSEAQGSAAGRAGEQEPAAATGPSKEPAAQKSQSEPSVRHGVRPLTKLPGEKAPVVTFMGPSKHGNPMFLVSSKVKSVFGESRCVSGDDACQLLEVPLNYPIVFVYGENEVHYTIEVLNMELIVVGHKPLDPSKLQ